VRCWSPSPSPTPGRAALILQRSPRTKPPRQTERRVAVEFAPGRTACRTERSDGTRRSGPFCMARVDSPGGEPAATRVVLGVVLDPEFWRSHPAGALLLVAGDTPAARWPPATERSRPERALLPYPCGEERHRGQRRWRPAPRQRSRQRQTAERRPPRALCWASSFAIGNPNSHPAIRTHESAACSRARCSAQARRD
jgi:hypothetical protein